MTSAFLASALLAARAVSDAAAPRRPVTDTYHGTAVIDDYRWLEDPASAEVQRWSDGQQARARATLDAFPGVAGLRDRLTAIPGGRDDIA